jgi:SAM-dependent methyltransferase
VLAEEDGDVLEGMLQCPAEACMREHPIIDGIPMIVDDIRSYVLGQFGQMAQRDDLSATMRGLIGDCLGPDSEFERNRYHLSTYGRSHYGDLDPDLPLARERCLVGLFDRGVSMLDARPAAEIGSGVWLDIGCSVGRTTFEMAAHTCDLVVGVDLNFGMLRMARQVARQGRVRHPLRQGGIVYRERDFAVDLRGRAQAEFWACDAMALPFANRNFAGALSFNITDCVPSPVAHLMELGRVLGHDAQAIVTTPYDWSSNATPLANWIGGHSQRSNNAGQSTRELRRVLSEDAQPEHDTRMVVAREEENVPWYVYVHERATMEYRVHVVVTRRLASKS